MNDQAFPYTLAFLRVRKELEELLASLLGEERHQTGRLSGRFSLNLEPVSQPPPPKGCKGLSAFYVTGSLLAKIASWNYFTFSW